MLRPESEPRIHRSLGDDTKDLNDLQVVITYDTSHTYNTYCLPSIIDKKYMNRHIFKNLDTSKVNEFYRGHKNISLEDDTLKEEIYNLFQLHGINNTLSYLSDVSYDAILSYMLYKKFPNHNGLLSGYINQNVKDSITELNDLHSQFSRNKNLKQVVRENTFVLLDDTKRFPKKL